MADLHNLLGELEEQEERFKNDDAVNDDDVDDDGVEKMGRPSLANTEVTEPMTLEDWESPPRQDIAVPTVLQEAKRHAQQQQQQLHSDLDDPMATRLDLADLLGETTTNGMNELYKRLHHFWDQERHCPEILEYDEAMVEDLKNQMANRQEWIESILEGNTGRNSGGQASVQTLIATIAQVDLDRARFVLSNWLACRLAKIEAYPLHMREKIDHLSDAELSYLKEYGSLLEEHLRGTVLDHIPEAWQSLDEPQMIDQPDYDGYHFWLVEEPVEADEVEQEKGTCLVAKYTAMKENMRQGKVRLQL